MATEFKEGDRVQVVSREATAEDVKSGLFYNFFAGMVGTVQKVYSSGEVAVEVEQESLAEAIAQRHQEIQGQMKSKWLDGISDEARNRLTEAEKDFKLRYSILVTGQDLTTPSAKPVAAAPASARLTSADLAAIEEAELQRRRNTGS